MNDNSETKTLGKVIHIDETQIHDHLGELVRGTVEDKCHFERLVAFSCKKRGFCPSCGARRMAETAALLSDEVFPDVPRLGAY